MQISLRKADIENHFQKGFSLVEILVGLSIIGLISAVLVPNAGRVLESFEFRAKIDTVKRDVSTYRVKAMLRQQTQTYPVYEDDSIIFPEAFQESGWRIEGDEIIFLKTGVCLGGDLLITSPNGRQRTVTFSAPTCS